MRKVSTARLFNGTTHESNHGADAGLNNVEASTFILVYKPTTVDATFRYLVRNGSTGTNINHNDDKLEFARGYSSGNATWFGTGTQVVADTWYITFFVDFGAGGADPEVYHARFGDKLEAPSFASRSDGTGTKTDESASDYQVGLRDSTRRFIGPIAYHGVISSTCSEKFCGKIYKIIMQGLHPSRCDLLSVWYGPKGKAIDRSGSNRHGTYTGTSYDRGPLLTPRRRPVEGFVAPAPSAGAPKGTLGLLGVGI